MHHKKLLKMVPNYGMVVVHFRCRFCGMIMPAVSLDGGELFELSWSQDARDTLQTCDKCNKTPVPVIRG